MAASSILVFNTAQLLAAVKSATAGAVILLAPGEYSAFDMTASHVAGGITITSQSTTNPAVMDGFHISNSSNITIANLVLNTFGSADYFPFRIISSDSISVDRVYAHGNLSAPAPPITGGLYIDGSTRVTVTNSVFRKLGNGIVNGNSSYLNESGNLFEALGADGIHNFASNNVVFSGNVFDSFQTVYPNHPDGIQFFTQGTTVSSYNITITGNLIYRGSGNPTQGVFLKDEVGTLPYHNVNISNNVVIGTIYNAIAGYELINSTISGNTVGGFSDYLARIFMDSSNTDVVQNNAAPIYILTADANLISKGNATIPNVTDGGAALIAAWRAAHPYFYSSLPASAVSNGLH